MTSISKSVLRRSRPHELGQQVSFLGPQGLLPVPRGQQWIRPSSAPLASLNGILFHIRQQGVPDPSEFGPAPLGLPEETEVRAIAALGADLWAPRLVAVLPGVPGAAGAGFPAGLIRTSNG